MVVCQNDSVIVHTMPNELSQQSAAYQERLLILKAKELSARNSTFSCRSFLWGFFAALIVTYIVLWHFLSQSGLCLFSASQLHCCDKKYVTSGINILQFADAPSGRHNSLLRVNYVKGSIVLPEVTVDVARPIIPVRTAAIAAVEQVVGPPPVPPQPQHVMPVRVVQQMVDTIHQVKASVPSSDVSAVSAAPIAAAMVVNTLMRVASPEMRARSQWSHLKAKSADQRLAILSAGHQFTSRNLILGIAVNTNAKNFAIFCGSFRKRSEQGEAVVFVNGPISDRHWSIALTHHIHLIEFEQETLEPEYLRKYHPSSIRWILFDRLFNANNGMLLRSFDRVLMVDIRDTMFQANPFQLVNGERTAYT